MAKIASATERGSRRERSVIVRECLIKSADAREINRHTVDALRKISIERQAAQELALGSGQSQS